MSCVNKISARIQNVLLRLRTVPEVLLLQRPFKIKVLRYFYLSHTFNARAKIPALVLSGTHSMTHRQTKHVVQFVI